MVTIIVVQTQGVTPEDDRKGKEKKRYVSFLIDREHIASTAYYFISE
jgi:hypothetical protein